MKRILTLSLIILLSPALLSSVLLNHVLLSPACAQPYDSATNPISNSGLTLSAQPWLGPQYPSFRGQRLTISNRNGAYDAIGAWHSSQNVADNTLTITNSSIHTAIAALNQGATLTSYNSLYLNADAHAQVALAATGQGTVRVNSLSLAGQANYAVSAVSLNGQALNNDLELSGHTTWALGGLGAQAANGNEVITETTSSATTVIGGLSPKGQARENSVTLMGTATTVVGGSGASGADSNFVDLMGTVETAVAAYSASGSAAHNTLNQWSGHSSKIIGAVAAGQVLGNIVNVSGSADTVLGAQSLQDAAYFNEVNLSASAVSGTITGASAAGPARYNEVSIEGTVTGSVTAAQSTTASADLNLLRVNHGTVTGDLVVAQAAQSAHNNTLLLNNATIGGKAQVAQAPSRAQNLAILRGTTYVGGTVGGAQEVSVDGTVTVGGLSDFQRLHILLQPQNDSATTTTPQYALHVTGLQGLDLRHKELWISGLNVPAADPSKLIYVDQLNQLIVDESTLIRGDETFVFNAWVPKDDHVFEHELIWSEAAPEPDPSPEPDPEPEPEPEPTPPAPNHNEIFEHSYTVDTAHAQTLLVTPAAAALTVAQGATLIDDVILPRHQVAPVMATRTYDFDFSAQGVLELKGASALLGVAVPYQLTDADLTAVLFMELGQGDYRQDFAGIAPEGTVSYGGLGLLVGLESSSWTLQGALRGGYLQSDFDAYFERTKDQVAYDYDTAYWALSLKGSYQVPITHTVSLVPQLRYDLIYLSPDDFTIEHKDRNDLSMDAMTLNSLRVGLATHWQATEQLGLSLGVYGRHIFSSRFTGTVLGYEIPSYQLDGTSYGVNLGAHGTIGPLEYAAVLRASWADLNERSGQLQLTWPF